MHIDSVQDVEVTFMQLLLQTITKHIPHTTYHICTSDCTLCSFTLLQLKFKLFHGYVFL